MRELHLFTVWSWLILFVLAYLVILFVQLLKNDWQDNQKLPSLVLIDIGFVVLTSFIYRFLHAGFLYNFIGFLVLVVASSYLCIFFFKNKNSRIFQFLLIILIGIFLIISSLSLFEYKKQIKYKLQAENILINGNAENDPIAELLIEELDKNIRADRKIVDMHTQAIALDSIKTYLQQHYLHVFWNKYDIQIHTVSNQSKDIKEYKHFLESTAQKINQTVFYSLPTSLYTMSFIGLVDLNMISDIPTTNNDAIYILEFYPTKDFRSYSFPDLFANKEKDVFSKTPISIAQYEDGVLTYQDNKTQWSTDSQTFRVEEDGFSKIKNKEDIDCYMYSSGDKLIVIQELSKQTIKNHLFFAFFVLLLFSILLSMLMWLMPDAHTSSVRVLGFTAKFQLLFIALLIVSFVGTLLFSVGYIKDDFERDQINYVESKKAYIQKSLQEMFYWTEDLAYVDRQSLNNSLQELAFRYQSDINIYDNHGKLKASSQPLVFSQNLVGDLISPQVIFSMEEPDYQYESIGELSYLAAYTDFINGDYLQLGYIAIPQYLSQTELNKKIEDYIAVIVQIYLIIMLLAIVVVLMIGRKLAEPIHLLANKMKLMRLDGTNEKVEYSSKDEIGQLVEQYNRTVDELEKNTQLLLASERESAWRTMARQVAHEINNPLTPMKLTIQQLQRTKSIDTVQFNAYFDKSTNLLIEQIDNLSRIASTFSQFAKLPETKFAEFDIVQKLLSVVELFKDNTENIEIRYQSEIEKLIVIGDAEQVIQVFTNIMKNAVQSIPSHAKGKIDVLLSRVDGKISIQFKDNGIGIPSDDQDNIFKPNFTTKNSGTGLGLSISKSIIENMGGIIYFESEEGKGTIFTIELKEK